VDELMVPAVDIPAQDVRPWAAVLERLLTDRGHYDELSARSRCQALEYARNLSAGPFEEYLARVVASPRRRTTLPAPKGRAALSDERRRLLALRVKRANLHVGH